MVKKRILLAEDDRDDRQFFHSFLQDRDDVDLMPAVENGLVLVNLLQSIADDADLPHLIILDQNMPKRNGLRTLEFLKDDPRFQSIPVVIYSTYTDEHLIEKGSEKGACMVWPKPTTKEGYYEMIDMALKFVESAGQPPHAGLA